MLTGTLSINTNILFVCSMHLMIKSFATGVHLQLLCPHSMFLSYIYAYLHTRVEGSRGDPNDATCVVVIRIPLNKKEKKMLSS